ncbi:hypothetical protein H1R20_g5882, partial [Candolleomyces eurysporus]
MGYWQPGTQYNNGDVVTYQGCDYKIIQPHRSQSDWAPDLTPALWGKMQGGGGGYGYNNSDCSSGQSQQTYQPPPQPQQPYQPPQPQQPPPPQYSYGNDNKPPQNQQPQQPQQPQKHDSDSEGEGKSSKKAWLIGGGIAAGAALLGAAGVAIHKHNEHEKEEAEWIDRADRRTRQFYNNGPTSPCTWVLNRGKSIPQGAIVVGQEHSWTLYIGRAFHKGSITPGKASDVFKKGAVIGYAHDEVHKDTYEILLGDMNGLKWVDTSGKLNVHALGKTPVDGGVDADGTPLYVARAQHKGVYHPGKCSEKLKAAFIPYDGGEVEVSNYQVLCYA